MTCATLMVHLQLGRPNTNSLLAVRELAERFQAGVVGVAVCRPVQLVYSEGWMGGGLFERDREEKDREIQQAEAEFRAAFRERTNALEWRSAVTLASTSEWVASEARCADLVVASAATAGTLDIGRRVDLGEVVMQVGRPVLIVPQGASAPRLQHAMIAWKDTRETRRTVADALPLLKKVAHVSVVEVAAEDDLAAARTRVADVVSWLGRHGIAAEGLAATQEGDNSTQLDFIAERRDADLVVAGAYGHSRVREWALGGVTRSLLLHSGRCSLLSH